MDLDDKKRQALLTALQVGIDDIKTARVVEKTARQIFDEVVARRKLVSAQPRRKGRCVFWILRYCIIRHFTHFRCQKTNDNIRRRYALIDKFSTKINVCHIGIKPQFLIDNFDVY